ncbi:hypothetical protein RISK_001633 [Rhodopirellula islandica]|uniref:Uncharacterized protein n=1 Tax=Rhodopirellula islandica TaxID=595434 RepID=A0A0J1BIR4_RHOIS|nr:hypothetical protein RISK_001633 [Rhodopirellula islandica]
MNSVGTHPPSSLMGETENTNVASSELAVSTIELEIVG